MPGISPIVRSTEAKARVKYRQLQELIPDPVDVALLASYLNVADLASYPIDGPLPEMERNEGNFAMRGRPNGWLYLPGHDARC
jgi:alkanesulfonate monooxygenase SsuD/methylene tetrahydromethanopterin reductase-like flavin-dependent oxidoreductase (luciferase family)